MLKKFILLLCLVFPLLSMAGNKGSEAYRTVQGTVYDASDEQALTGVKVHVVGTDLVVYTDEAGNFELNGFFSAEVELSFSFITFEAKQLQWNADSFDQLVVELQER